MDYVQMTLSDWVEMKQKLKQELLGVKQSFVRIGFVLRKIEDGKLYEQDGYKSVAEFAEAEYGLEPSTTSRFMSINREYSIDGYSEHLRPEYADLGRSQLEEMLKLPEADRKMIQPEASREHIRELKRFNKSEPEAGVADDIRKLIEHFFRDNTDILRAVFQEDTTNIKKLAEIINPSGNRSYKKGLYFLMMYENKIVIKKFGNIPQEMPWEEFIRLTVDIFGEAAAEGDAELFGSREDPDEEVEDSISEQSEEEGIEEEDTTEEKSNSEDCENSVERENIEPDKPKEKIAPAQKSPEILGTEDKIENENKVIFEETDSNELSCKFDKDTRCLIANKESYECKEAQTCMYIGSFESDEVEPGTEVLETAEVIERAFGTRKAYMDTLTAAEMAVYIGDEYKSHRLKASALELSSELEEWLKELVTENGQPLEEN